MTVAPQKKAKLQKIYIAQKWLTDLQASTSLPLEYEIQNLVLQYKKFIGKAHGNWPSVLKYNVDGNTENKV